MPYSSPFEAAVGSFLQGYSGMRGLRLQEGEAADRRRQARRSDQLAQIGMNEAGYDEVQMPEIQAPPGQSFAQKVGRFLSGPEQPSTIVVKTHPSVRDSEIAGAQQFDLARDQSRFDNDRAVTELQGALQARLDANRQAHEDARNRDDNATRLAVAGMERSQREPLTTLAAKHAAIDDAIQATGGYAQQAYNQIPDDVKKKFRIGATDMNAGVQRWRDSKTVLTREAIQSREDIANKKGSAKEQFRRQLLESNPPSGANYSTNESPSPGKPGDPAGSMSDADAWEYYVSHGATAAQATAKVNARKK